MLSYFKDTVQLITFVRGSATNFVITKELAGLYSITDSRIGTQCEMIYINVLEKQINKQTLNLDCKNLMVIGTDGTSVVKCKKFGVTTPDEK